MMLFAEPADKLKMPAVMPAPYLLRSMLKDFYLLNLFAMQIPCHEKKSLEEKALPLIEKKNLSENAMENETLMKTPPKPLGR
jgi:hypothetical protein